MKDIYKAKWITAPISEECNVYTFKRNFQITKRIKKATLYISAVGIYVPYINGVRVGENIFCPGWTSYKHRVQYQEYDVTTMISEDNVLEIRLGEGWAVGYIGLEGVNHVFADNTSLIVYLDVEYHDNSHMELISDETWEVYSSEVIYSQIYHGEYVDKTVVIDFLGNAILSSKKFELIPQVGEFIKEQERIAPVEFIRTPKNELVIDFGQNITGYVEIRIQGPRGSKIVVHHAEVLDKDGNFYSENMRGAKNENTYVLSGNDDVFKPSFSFQGFQYIKLVEYPFEIVDKDAFCAIAVHSDIKRTGEFSCGNKKINQLYHNILWGQKGNYLDVPTDCPQRDERLGWTGDAQVFCKTAAINYDVEKFFDKWLGDLVLEQKDDGAVGNIVPYCNPTRPYRVSAAWGDAVCIIPWQMYMSYGNLDFLKKYFPAMKKWVNYLRSVGTEEYLWLGGWHYGDWLALDAGEDSLVGATSNDLIASAFYAYSTEIVVKAGEILGENVDEYKLLYNNIVKAFRSYFMENGMPKEEFPYTEVPLNGGAVDTTRKGITQTAIVLILQFGLCAEGEKANLAKTLVNLIKENGNKMSTGFVGTPYLLHVLSDNGYVGVAYELLMQEESPSWLYSVCHGATTMWEHWDSIKADGSFWDAGMNSFNHYAYGAVFDWIFEVVIGISPLCPAYKKIKLAPHPNKCLGFAKASIDTKNGLISSYWYYKEDVVYYEFAVPSGVIAKLELPSGYTKTLTKGIYHFVDKY